MVFHFGNSSSFIYITYHRNHRQAHAFIGHENTCWWGDNIPTPTTRNRCFVERQKKNNTLAQQKRKTTLQIHRCINEIYIYIHRLYFSANRNSGYTQRLRKPTQLINAPLTIEAVFSGVTPGVHNTTEKTTTSCICHQIALSPSKSINDGVRMPAPFSFSHVTMRTDPPQADH